MKLPIELPPWVETIADPGRLTTTDVERMHIVIALANENVRRGTIYNG